MMTYTTEDDDNDNAIFTVYSAVHNADGGGVSVGTDETGVHKTDADIGIKGTVLEEAFKLIYLNRENDYGPPQINLKNIANLWGAYLKTTILPKDVAILMALLKIARLMLVAMPVRDARDSVIDAAGYIGLLERLEENK